MIELSELNVTRTRETKSADVILRRMLAKCELVTESGCWIWMGADNGDQGYGRVYLGGKSYRAHRLMYELIKGKVPGGLDLDHLCRVRCCVNPAHLEPVTNLENLLRGEHIGVATSRRGFCKNGHARTSSNLRYYEGRYFCRECERVRALRRRRRRMVPDCAAGREGGGMAVLDINGLLGRLEGMCEQEGSQYQWATKHKLSPAYVSDVLRCKRMPGPGILKAMGVQKITMYATKPGH